MCGSHLVIQLLRFRVNSDGTTVKINDPIAFCKSLEFPVTSHDGSLSTKLFTLKGFICHLGTLNNGHYTAVVLDRSGKSWLNCDDSTVSLYHKNDKDLLSSSAYLLFYEQVR